MIVLLALGLLLMIQMTIRTDVQYSNGRLQVLLRLSWHSLHKDWHLTVYRSEHGHLLTINGSGPSAVSSADFRSSLQERSVKLLLQSSRVRRYLFRHLRLTKLDVSFRLHQNSAAATALITGVTRTLFSCFSAAWRRAVRVCVIPEFTASNSIFSARCILQFRMGTILITAGMLLLTKMAEHVRTAREAGLWNTPSEN